MTRVTLEGEELAGFDEPEPAASVRVLLPIPASAPLVMPTWNGNEFLLPDGERPIIRTFTPRGFDPAACELDVDIVLHDGGAASEWAVGAGSGDQVAVSGPGRGYRIDPTASSFLLAGDETAIPAIGQLMEQIDDGAALLVLIEISHPEARLQLPDHPGAVVDWLVNPAGDPPGKALAAAVTGTTIKPGTKVWVAGEAGSLVPIRKHLFETLDLERSEATVRGYWKHGRRASS